ncbi:hypothetical protein C2G38_2204700 [Gigaspora rosea]|uniref:Uncharacterized protein n=1 Tax=Gigaspora rosea TaxID=44941 RepID=A0A397ULF6_9GLOM|nr:hypothetical protein C2G38_2204700 [Gigaspora rosea]
MQTKTILFDRLFDVKEIGKGGIQKFVSDSDYDSDDYYIYKSTREPSRVVVFKTLVGSKEKRLVLF